MLPIATARFDTPTAQLYDPEPVTTASQYTLPEVMAISARIYALADVISVACVLPEAKVQPPPGVRSVRLHCTGVPPPPPANRYGFSSIMPRARSGRPS